MEVEIDELINTVFREEPKGPNDIQLSFVDDMELKELFEFLLMVFTKGCKIHYADNNGVVNLALCTDTEFKHIDKYMRSMGFKLIIDRYTEEDYFPFGNISYLHMIHTKYLRIMNLAQSDKTTNFESLEDSLTDMSVYCAMFSAYLQNKKMEENDYDIKEASIIDKINFEKGI